MGVKDLKPVRGEGRGVALGVILSVVLQVAALVVIAIIGTAIGGREGALLTLPFIALVGLTQWIYLGPAAWLLRRRGAAAMAKGVVIAGGLVTLGSTLCYGGMGLMTLQQGAEVQRLKQDERAHPSDFISTDGVVAPSSTTRTSSFAAPTGRWSRSARGKGSIRLPEEERRLRNADARHAEARRARVGGLHPGARQAAGVPDDRARLR